MQCCTTACMCRGAACTISLCGQNSLSPSPKSPNPLPPPFALTYCFRLVDRCCCCLTAGPLAFLHGHALQSELTVWLDAKHIPGSLINAQMHPWRTDANPYNRANPYSSTAIPAKHMWQKCSVGCPQRHAVHGCSGIDSSADI